MVALDREGRIVRCNHACEHATGCTFAEAQGRPLWDFLLPPAEIEPVKVVFAELKAGQFPNQHENHWLAKDGTLRLISWNNTAITGASGVVDYVVGTGLDITERKRAQAERERLEAMPTLADYLNVLQLRFPNGQPVPLDDLAINRALGGEVVSARQARCIHPVTGQRLDLLISAAPLRDNAERIVGAVEVARDISERSELDRLKDEFLSVAAHELKTPVTITKGYSQALLRTTADLPATHHRMLESINRGADRIDGLVNDLLDIVRLQSGGIELRSERIDLGELVGEVVNRLAITTSKHRVLVTRATPVVVYGDRARLEQVLENIVDNALRYSPEGGDVDVSVDVEEDTAIVSVRDRGVGIPEGRQARIGERFYRAHTNTPYDYGGMGVGLYISQEIVARHGGRLWFDSEEGRGSTFHFSLPLRRADDAD